MPDNTEKLSGSAKSAQKPKYEITRPKDGVYYTYTDYIHAFWTGLDFSLRLYQLIQPNLEAEPNAPNVVEERAVITMSWSEVKILRNLLIEAVERREKVYGEIRTDYSQLI